MMRSFIFLLAAILLPMRVAAQKLTIWDRITFVETLADPLKGSQPGYATMTHPSDAKDFNYNVQAALGYNFLKYDTSHAEELNLVIEEHRNTLIQKEQNNFQVGLNHYYIINYGKWNNKDYSWWNVALQNDFTYTFDGEKKTEGIVARTYLSPQFRKPDKFYGYLLPEFMHPNSTKSLFKWIRYQYFVSTGLEYVSNYQYDASTGAKTNIGMYYLDLRFSVFPLGGLTNNSFKLYYNFTDRWDLISSNASKNTDRILRKYGAAFIYKFEGKKKPEIQLAYEIVHGEDITRAMAEQQYNQLSLKIKFK